MTKIYKFILPAKDFANYFSYFIHEYDVVDLQNHPFGLVFLHFVTVISPLVENYLLVSLFFVTFVVIV